MSDDTATEAASPDSELDSLEPASTEERISVDEQLLEWQFFRPSIPLTRRIWLLNEKLGSAYFDNELARLTADEPEPDLGDEVTQDQNWFKGILARVSEIVLHYEEGSPHLKLSDDEFDSFFQKMISERIYNHLAMLHRTPHAQSGGAFSLHEELTEGIVEKIGLGASQHHKTNPGLRSDCETALNDLADEFEKWFIGEHKGYYPTVWGEIRASAAAAKAATANALILTPNVRRGLAFTAGGGKG
jgi:hypothetical protein